MIENEISPGPWEVVGDIIEWSPKQKSPFDDQGASILASNGQYVVEGGSQDEQGGAVGVLRMPDAIAIAALPDIIAERDALRAEVERLTAMVELLQTTSRCAWCGTEIVGESPDDRGRLGLEHLLSCPSHPLRKLEARIAELTAENERLREALEWYADGLSWYHEEPAAWKDYGERARAALAGEGE